MGTNRAIGKDGDLPWRLPADLAYFKQTTMGHPIIMGRKTFDSFPGLLPDRTHIVLTRQDDLEDLGAVIVHDKAAALEAAAAEGAEQVFVIGGAQIYNLFFEDADLIFLTRVDAAPEADAFFPEFEADGWLLNSAEAHPADEKNAHDYTFQVYQRFGLG